MVVKKHIKTFVYIICAIIALNIFIGIMVSITPKIVTQKEDTVGYGIVNNITENDNSMRNLAIARAKLDTDHTSVVECKMDNGQIIRVTVNDNIIHFEKGSRIEVYYIINIYDNGGVKHSQYQVRGIS